MRARTVAFRASGAAAVAWAAWQALGQWWTADDAFISFRYARHLVEGLGLVFNAGERVQGYTNLLWTLWAAVGLRLGIPAESWANATGLVCGLATIVLLLLQHRRDADTWTQGRFWLPLAALGTAVAPDWATWSVSGMETPLFALLLTGLFVVAARALTAEDDRPRLWALAGVIAGLAALTRPDGLLPAWVTGLAVLVWGRRRWIPVASYAAAFACVWLPPTLWRIAYYGDFFPNTYYAKSAWIAWYAQGGHYLALFFERYWALLAGPLLLVAALVVRRRRDRERLAVHGRPIVLALALALTYTAYVIRVGGDFMFARLLVPVLPLYLLLLEYGLMLAPRLRPVWGQLVGAGLLAGIALTPSPVEGTHWVYGVADERAYYSKERVEELDHSAEVLRRVFAGLPVRVAFYGDEARLVYEADFPVAIEAHAGLTDRFVAHQPLEHRGRVGHEKHAPLDYLVDQRAVHFTFSKMAGRFLDLRDEIPEVIVIFDPRVYGQVLTWDPELMDALRRRGVDVPDFLGAVDASIARLDEMSPQQVRALYEKLRKFYFMHHADPAREAAFLRRLEPAP